MGSGLFTPGGGLNGLAWGYYHGRWRTGRPSGACSRLVFAFGLAHELFDHPWVLLPQCHETWRKVPSQII